MSTITQERVTVRAMVPATEKERLDRLAADFRRFHGDHAGDVFSAALILGVRTLKVWGYIPGDVRELLRG